jgi:hypothetical protein
MSADYDLLIRGEIVKRKFIPDNIALYQRWLDKHDGKRVQFGLSKERKMRSNPQLAYYWGVLIVVCMAEHGVRGERAKNQYHENFLINVAQPMLIDKLSRLVREDVKLAILPSTGGFTVEEMTDYIRRCQDYAHREWGVNVPDIDHVAIRRR